MGDQVPIKTVNPQKKRMIMPDVMLYTQNVMIPIVKPVPSNQSFNISFFKHKPQILKAHNYKNNALLFPKTTSCNPLDNLLEVNRMNCWKPKNQSTKYTISGKTDSPDIKKVSISQNSCLSHEKRNNTLHFPDTMFEQLAPLTSNKDLCKASSKSIKLSRKCNLSQMKEGETKHEDKFVPRMETPMSISPVVSLSSQSFYDCTDTVSTVSTLSASSFKIENKKTNIERKSMSRIASQHLYPTNSEHEISVLHYENDVLSGTNFPHSLQSYLKSSNTNWSLANNSSMIQTKNGNIIDKKSAMKDHQQKMGSTIHDIKYSWEIDDCVSSSQRKRCDNKMKDVKIHNRKPYDCEIKYSWQVMGTSTQTSYTLLQDLLNNTENNKPAYKMCSIKYSWQIIGTGTQASLHDYNNDPDYWSGILLTANKNYNENSPEIGDNETDCTKLQDFAKYPEGRLKKYLMLNNQQTQTFTEKEIQANPIDCYAKYSWHKLIKAYL